MIGEDAPAPVAPVVPAGIRFGPDDLAPAIVQDATDGRVLMLGYMDPEALARTVATGEVHFHSRSRGRLWRKGETSGNVLRLVSLAIDCDADALLVTTTPVGPTCHRGSRSCFDDPGAAGDAGVGASGGGAGVVASVGGDAGSTAPAQGFAWLEELWSTIASRAAERPTGSYTSTLLAGGVDAVGRKVVEEATEVLLAAKDDVAGSTSATRAAISAEAADLLYHALVLLAERGVSPSTVIVELRARHGASQRDRARS